MSDKLRIVSDETILNAMKGDAEAFTEIYYAYNQRVFFVALQYFRNEDTAKDIVQEVFIKVYKQIHKLKIPKALTSWIHVITYRECQNYNRKKMIVFNLDEDEDFDKFPDLKAVNAMEVFENQRIKDAVVESLDTMKKELRTVAILRFFEELSIQEISKILEIPEGTTKSRISRVRKLLSNDLEEKGFRKNLRVTAVSPIFLHEIYSMLCSQHTMSEAVTDNILSIVLKGGGVAASGISLLTKWVLGGLISTAIMGGVYIININTESEPVDIKEEVIPSEVIEEETNEENSKIVNLTYDTQWQQTAVQLDIETTNSNYDKITINDIETLKIGSNGNYIVKLIKNEEVIDEKEITISNIDRQSPTAYSEEDEEYYYFYLTDEESGVNKDAIGYFRNGIASREFTYYENENKLVVKNDKVSQHEIYISDYAGNILSIEIK
ncbi:MAG: RNA polymerase sigma factor [Coprobacillaceae bacterium]